MKITYIANARIPTDKAHGLQIIKMCHSFSQLGHQVNLVVPKRYNEIKIDPFEYYQVDHSFKIKKMFCFDFWIFHQISGRLIYYLRTMIFSFLLLFNSSVRKADIIYTRDIVSVFLLALFKKNIFYEMHYFVKGKKIFYKKFLNSVRGLVTINNWKMEKLISDYNIEAKKIIASPSGVEIADFNILPDNLKMKEKYQIPLNKIIFGYIGRFKTVGMDKGLDILLQAFKKSIASNQNNFLALFGGGPAEVLYYQQKIKELNLANQAKILPHLPYNQVKEYYSIPDVFLLTYPKNDHYNYYMSPIKLMEYVASKKPVIASDLHSIRELFNENEISYFEPDNINQLRDRIIELSESAEKRKILAEKAYRKIKNYNWEVRAKQIIQFITETYKTPIMHG